MTDRASSSVVKDGVTQRVHFTPEHKVLDLPDLVGHLKSSWRRLVENDLGEVFQEVSPVDDYTGEKLSLSFKSYRFGEPKFSDKEAMRDNASYEAPLYATVELVNRTTGEVKESELYMGEYPWMTDRGTFIVNGSERVVVSQLVRSNGVYFDADSVDDALIDANPSYSELIGSDALDVQQYGAYLSYSFTPAIALRGYYYWQDLDDGWLVADDSPSAWSAMLEVKQDLLKFTSLWIQYVEQDNSFIGPRAANQYPAIFAPGLDGPVGGDGTNKTFLVTAEQQWNDKWSSFVQYLTTDWDHSDYDDTDQYMIGVGYQYTPAIKFWLAYNYIDYGDNNPDYNGSESVVLFRTSIDF